MARRMSLTSRSRLRRQRWESFKLACSIGLVGLLSLPICFLLGAMLGRMAVGV